MDGKIEIDPMITHVMLPSPTSTRDLDPDARGQMPIRGVVTYQHLGGANARLSSPRGSSQAHNYGESVTALA